MDNTEVSFNEPTQTHTNKLLSLFDWFWLLWWKCNYGRHRTNSIEHHRTSIDTTINHHWDFWIFFFQIYSNKRALTDSFSVQMVILILLTLNSYRIQSTVRLYLKIFCCLKFSLSLSLPLFHPGQILLNEEFEYLNSLILYRLISLNSNYRSRSLFTKIITIIISIKRYDTDLHQICLCFA